MTTIKFIKQLLKFSLFVFIVKIVCMFIKMLNKLYFLLTDAQ